MQHRQCTGELRGEESQVGEEDQMELKPWEILESQYVVDDRWMRLRADKCRTAHGTIVEPYYVSESADWVHIAALDEKQRLLVTRQYRHAAGKISLELPCGVVETNESPEQTVIRELREETGAEVQLLTRLSTMDPNPARRSNRVHSFLGQGAQIVHPQRLDASEEITFEFVELSEILNKVDRGEFSQALHIATLFLALRRLGASYR